MGFLLDFQFVNVLGNLVILLWLASTPYMGARSAEAGSRWGNTNILYIILTILAVIAVILEIVFLAGGHAH